MQPRSSYFKVQIQQITPQGQYAQAPVHSEEVWVGQDCGLLHIFLFRVLSTFSENQHYSMTDRSFSYLKAQQPQLLSPPQWGKTSAVFLPRSQVGRLWGWILPEEQSPQFPPTCCSCRTCLPQQHAKSIPAR